MELNEIQALIKFVAKAGVSEVQLEQDGFKIVIKTPGREVEQIMVPAMQPQIVHQMAPVQQAAAPATVETKPAPAAPAAEVSSNLITVKAPMIGTFYRSPGPDKPLFVNVGDEIKTGQVLCIIEAMKLFNEIESEISGRIVKVLVDDASPVEYDQPLFLVEPK